VAEDAVASIIYALRTRLSGSSQEALWAARRAYESLDQHVMSRLNKVVVTPDIERRVLADPLIQAELERQQRDLSDLVESSNQADLARRIVRLRDRAKRDAERFMHLDA